MLNIFLEVVFMDYFSVIVLITITFVFISDRYVKSIEDIKEAKKDIDIIEQINIIKEKMDVIKICEKDMNPIDILKITRKSKKEYILIQNNKLELNNTDADILVANYINSNQKPCGFNLLYVNQETKWSLKRLYIDIINYLNIFNRKDLSTYGVIICKMKELIQQEKTFKKQLISYIPTNATNIELKKEEIKTTNLKKIYINKIKEANISIIIRILLLIVSGSIITTNLIYSILNVNNSINGLIISSVIYYCYSYIIRYIYKPIGKQRILASYIFPIYFITYIIVGIYTFGTKVIKKVHAS